MRSFYNYKGVNFLRSHNHLKLLTSVKIHDMKQTELKREIGKSTITVGDFNTPPSVINRSKRQKISKDTDDLYSTIN